MLRVAPHMYSVPKAVLGVSLLLLTLHCSDDAEPTEGAGGTGGSTTNEILMLTGDATAGQAVYADTCGQGTCHGPDGDTGSSAAPMHSVVIPMFSDAQIIDTIRFGTIDDGGVMPPQSQLGNQEIADVLAYLRQTFP